MQLTTEQIEEEAAYLYNERLAIILEDAERESVMAKTLARGDALRWLKNFMSAKEASNILYKIKNRLEK